MKFLPIKDCPLVATHNIPIKPGVKYLGINIIKDNVVSENFHIWNLMNKGNCLEICGLIEIFPYLVGYF